MEKKGQDRYHRINKPQSLNYVTALALSTLVNHGSYPALFLGPRNERQPLRVESWKPWSLGLGAPKDFRLLAPYKGYAASAVSELP